MPTRLKRYYGAKHLHFITCSCYCRLPLQAVSDFWKVIASPLDPSKDNWAGPGGMGPPGGRGDWAAAVHEYNFETNHIKIGSYFNPFLSPATSRALIKSNNTLMRNAGGIQSLKMGLFFGPVNALQWYANSWK